MNPATARIAWIKNTLAVQRLWVSDPLWPEIRARGEDETIGEPESMRFDEGGGLLVGPNSRVGN